MGDKIEKTYPLEEIESSVEFREFYKLATDFCCYLESMTEIRETQAVAGFLDNIPTVVKGIFNGPDLSKENDKISADERREFLKIIQHKLLDLYSAALKLRWVQLTESEDFDEKVDPIFFKNMLNTLSRKFGAADYYWHVFDVYWHLQSQLPDSVNPAATCGQLLDDLGDTYKELKEAIMVYNLGRSDCKMVAIWQFKFDFDAHWGTHCINALNAIYVYLRETREV